MTRQKWCIVQLMPQNFSRQQMQRKEKIMNPNCNTTAYDVLYLEDVVSVHELLFSKLVSHKPELDVFSMINVYMQHSEVRRKMDLGNWSALNKGWKQLFNSVDFSLCKPKAKDIQFDDILLGWVAYIYVFFQWKYNIPSAEINKKIPAEVLCDLYSPLHEISYEKACEKLYNKFFG